MTWMQDKINARASNDSTKLSLLGYKQELNRHLSAFHSFAVTFSFLSPITGLTGTYAYLMLYGGPVTAIWGWCLVSAASMLLGLSMAEIVSAYPTTGGVYFWAYKLGGAKYRNIACWLTGWFNTLGMVASTAGVAYTTASLISSYILLGTGTAQGGGVVLTNAQMLGVYTAVLVLLGLVNIFCVKILDAINEISVWWHCFFGTAFVIALPLIAPTHLSAKTVFTSFTPDHVYSGIDSSALLFLLGLLGSQWAMVGYDTAAHLAEETQGADISGPISLLGTIMGGYVVGLAFLLSVTFSIQDFATLGALDGPLAGGNYVMQVAWDAFTARYGSGIGSLGLMVVPLMCTVFCGNACLIANSRVVWAFSRDGALPLSRYWRQLHPTFKTPVNATILCCILCFILGLPMLDSTVAFAAITSIGVIGLYISYAVPLVFRVTVGRKQFSPGPFNLGRFGVPITCLACLWIAFAIILFVMPQVYPVTSVSLNYAPVAVGVVLVISIGWWVIDARKWFKGPRRTVQDEEEGFKAVERDSASDSAEDVAEVKTAQAEPVLVGKGV